MKYRWLIWTVAVLISLPAVIAGQALLLRLPAPFSQISLPLLFLSINLLIWKNGGIVWYAAALYATLDLYTATPFGLVLYAGTLAMLTVFWLYRAVITNQGIFAVALVTAVLCVAFNIWYAFGRAVLWFAFDRPFSGSAWLAGLVTELLATTAATVIVYAILARLVPALKVTHARTSLLYERN